jgi:hypothetical protein
MAILDGLKNAVAANVARSANNVAVNGLRSIAGDIFGVDLNPTNPAAKLENRTTKFTTKNLAYPAGVEGDDQQGHYIIFEILQQDKAKIKKNQSRIAELQKVVDLEYAYIGKSSEKAIKDLEAEQIRVKEMKARQGKLGNSIQLSQDTTTRIATMIALYMPPSLSVSYNSKYGDKEIGVLAAAGSAALAAFASQSGTQRDSNLRSALDNIGKGLETAVMATVDTVAPGATALLALEKGAIRTPKMELMFEGIGRREFSFEFTFIPKDVEEARTIQDIVKQFKFHMASNYTDTTFREMEIPSFFNIRYMYRADENPFLNKISTCALEGMDVSYGGDRFVSYEGGRPQTTKISLKFKEMEIITKDQIDKGF